MFDRVLTDLRFALRLLSRKPRLYATIFVVLIGGIATTTAMFSVVKSLLLEPLPFPNPERLVAIFGERTGEAAIPTRAGAPERHKISLPDFYDWRARTRSFEHMAVERPWLFLVSSPGRPAEGVSGAHVSGEFFSTYGIRAALGRLLDERDDRVGGPRVVVISHGFWRDRLGSDPHIIGRTVQLDGEPFTVIGVTPEEFVQGPPELSVPARVWVPFAPSFPSYSSFRAARDQQDVTAVGRLRPGVSLEEAGAELRAVAKEVEREHPGRGASALVVSLQEELIGDARTSIYVLFAAVLLVFFVACSNVANLLLTSVLARRAEFATRAALGATRARLMQQIITEAVFLFLLAAPLGALGALGLVELFRSTAAIASVVHVVRLDAEALAACLFVSLLAGLSTGLASTRSLSDLGLDHALKEQAAGASTSRSSRTLSGALVTAQVAIACTLLIASGLAFGGFFALTRAPYGFQTENLATGLVLAARPQYWQEDELARFYERVLTALSTRPDVESTAAASATPLLCAPVSGYFEIEGRPDTKSVESHPLLRNIVTPGYFRTLGIPILKGRDFTADDRRTGRPVTIISQSAADRAFPGEDPIGRRILHHAEDVAVYREIVGVVADVRRRGPYESPLPESYVPAAQAPWRTMQLVVRSPNAKAVLAELPNVVAGVDPEVAVSYAGLMDDHVLLSLRIQAATAFLLAGFALAALLLATLGIYGLVAYTTGRRTRELGIRLALGTPAHVVVLLVVRSGLTQLALGLAIGIALALGLGSVIASHLAGVDSLDPSLYMVVVTALLVVGLFSCLVPAWRAVRVPPSTILRYE